MYLLLFVIAYRTELAMGIGNIILLLVFLVEYFVHAFRGTVLVPSDLYAVNTALSVLTHYKFQISQEAFYTILYLIFFTAFGFRIRLRMGKNLIKRAILSASSIGIVAAFYILTMHTTFMEDRGITGHYWNMSENQLLNGTFISFLVIHKESRMVVPAVYSIAQVERLTDEYMPSGDGNGKNDRPNIIMIMNEAWSDLNVLGELETTERVMPFFKDLEDNTVKGNLAVSIWGGLTVNTEYESLTGDSLALLSPTVIPYCNQITHDIYALPRVLQAQGYYTMAMHPNGEGVWGRDKVYAHMGFDEFISVDKFQTDYEYLRGFITDKSNFNEIIWQYENRDKSKPFFLFDVTIQNHSGYYGEIELPVEISSVNGDSPEEVGYLYDVQTYLNLINITDESFAELIAYFEQIDEPTVICMFGDHQPRLGDNFYQYMFQDRGLTELDENMLCHITPYCIWANYDIEDKDYGDFSANYLPAVLLDYAGLETTPYYSFLLETMEDYPVLSAVGCMDRSGRRSLISDIEDEEVIKQYRILQYNHLYEENAMGSTFLPENASVSKGIWHEENRAVMHALGATAEGDTLTNSLEAFQTNYEKGQKVFEADIQITSDGQMVLRHDWDSDLGQAEAFGWGEGEKEVPTAEAFLATPIYGKYTPLSLASWFEIMKRYPDIYFVTDTKYSSDPAKDFQLFVDTADQAGCESVLDRVVVQIYYPDMFQKVKGVYPFSNYIYTLYYIGYAGPEETAGFCEENGIPVLTMPVDWWWGQLPEELGQYETKIYVHTVNDEQQAQNLIENEGVSGIYTDYIDNQTVRHFGDGLL